MKMHAPVVDDFGGAPIAEHDMACAVCWTRKAVLNLSQGRFEPCWFCQREGWRLVKRRWWVPINRWAHYGGM